MIRRLIGSAENFLRSGRQQALAGALIAAACLTGAPVAAAAQQPGQSGVVVDGHARFTVITPTLIRMEYSRDGKFINERSYFAWERNVKPPQFAVQRLAGTLSIATARMKLTWNGGTEGFDAGNLSITFRNDDGGSQTWHPGEEQTFFIVTIRFW